MARPVVVLHGWSDTRKSFRSLGKYLASRGFRVTPIFLGEYISLEDNITIEDLAKAFESALEKEGFTRSKRSMDLIVHSTGALVAREWLTRFYLQGGYESPVFHLLMLAPANFGSPLADKGRSMIGRLFKGWKTGFETGTQILKALEMASPYSWNLAQRDLFGRSSFYNSRECMTGVLVGTSPYKDWPRNLVNKRGSDGTVYVSTANLNASHIAVRLGEKGEKPIVRPKRRAYEPIAFAAIAGRDHSSITKPKQRDSLGDLMVKFLGLETEAQYEAFRMECEVITGNALPAHSLANIEYDGRLKKTISNYRHSYQNTVVRVRDDLGLEVKDYFLEFYEGQSDARSGYKGEDLMSRVHKEVLEDVHPYKDDEAYRSFIFDNTDLDRMLASGARLLFSLSAAPLGSHLSYSAGSARDLGELEVGTDNQVFWRPNETVFVDLIIERKQSPKVLTLKRVNQGQGSSPK